MTGSQRAGPSGPGFWLAVVAGWSVIVAASMWLMDQPLAHAPDLGRFLAGLLVIHDLVLAPLVTAAGLVVARVVPARWRAPVQGGLVVTGMVALFAFPFVRGYGRRPDDPSALPVNYGRGLLIVLAMVTVVTGGLTLRRRAGRERESSS